MYLTLIISENIWLKTLGIIYSVNYYPVLGVMGCLGGTLSVHHIQTILWLKMCFFRKNVSHPPTRICNFIFPHRYPVNWVQYTTSFR